MKITLIAIGTRMPDWVLTGYQEYASRLPSDYFLKLLEIPAEKRGKGADIERIAQKEGEQMLAAIPKGDTIIALSERGQLWNNRELAHKLSDWHDNAINISLLIGGPEGLSSACLQQADLHWSLSPLTFPHPLVRIILAEQLYRSWSILQNHPYHR